jgi:hypothetical protein
VPSRSPAGDSAVENSVRPSWDADCRRRASAMGAPRRRPFVRRSPSVRPRGGPARRPAAKGSDVGSGHGASGWKRTFTRSQCAGVAGSGHVAFSLVTGRDDWTPRRQPGREQPAQRDLQAPRRPAGTVGRSRGSLRLSRIGEPATGLPSAASARTNIFLLGMTFSGADIENEGGILLKPPLLLGKAPEFGRKWPENPMNLT